MRHWIAAALLPSIPPGMIPSEFGKVLPQAGSVTLVRGLDEVLRLQPLLSAFAACCAQLGAVDYLEYYLTGPYVGVKTPCLFLVHLGPPWKTLTDVRIEHLIGAFLLYEYKIGGIDTGIYVTDDDAGERTVLARPGIRLDLAFEVAKVLLGAGARMVLMTLRSGDTMHRGSVGAAVQTRSEPRSVSAQGKRPMLWTSRERLLRRTLPLFPTFDETLAPMGRHTRRNLRAARRRAELEMQAVFVPRAEITLEEFVALNRLCSYPVPDRVAVWRYQTAKKIDSGFIVGVKAGSGEWLSLLGGRRHHGVTEISWQMNRDALGELSLSTVMRSFLIEHEATLGTKNLYFEGGTTQSIQGAFREDRVLDLLVSGDTIPSALLRRLATWVVPRKNFLCDMLRDGSLVWSPEQPEQPRETGEVSLGGWGDSRHASAKPSRSRSQ